MQRSGLIATKIGNSSYFQNDGTNTHVTILKVDECIVSKIKTTENQVIYVKKALVKVYEYKHHRQLRTRY